MRFLPKPQLEGIPLEFLEAYPYPAFVLNVPIPSPTADAPPITKLAEIPFTRNMQSTIHTFRPIWSNSKWNDLVRAIDGEPMASPSVVEPAVRRGEVDLLRLLDVKAARTFGNWISGLTDFERREERERMGREGHGLGSNQGSTSIVSGATPVGESVAPGVETRRSPRIDVQRETEPVDSSADSLGLVKGSPLAMDVDDDDDDDDITKRKLHEILESTPASPRMNTPPVLDDDRILETMTTQSTVLLKLRRPHDIWLELLKTPLPQHPKSTTTSLLVIQAIPRSAREVEMLGRAGKKTACTNGETFSTGGIGHILSPSIDMNRVNISRASDPPPSTDATHEAWPFLTHTKDSSYDTETPMVDRDDPMTAAGTFQEDPEDELARRRKLVAKYYPDEEPLLVGDVDLGQLTSFPRKTVADPTSTESLLLTTDWSKTPLGPLEKWSSSLKTAVSIVMAMPNQANLWWNGGNGNKDDLTMVYNDHYAAMLQSKHPWLFGKTSAEGWAEIWSALGPVAEKVMSGTSITRDDDEFLLETREGEGDRLEEYYHSWSWVPVKDESGEVGGLLNYTRNTTAKVVAERRLRCMREVSDLVSAARDMEEFDRAIIDGLSGQDIAKDVPFALLYHVVQDDASSDNANNTMNITEDRASISGNAPVRLKLTYGGSLGAPKGHPSVPAETTVSISRPPRILGGLDPARTSSPTMSLISALSAPKEDEDFKVVKAEKWPFKEVLQSRKAVVIEDCSSLVEGFEVRSWDTLPNSAIGIPLCSESSSDIPSAVLIVGLNLRRRYDQHYAEWLHQLRLQLYGGLLQVHSQEAERQRALELQAMDRIKSNWISGVSHELRLPLTLVSGPLDDLAKEAPAGSRAKSLLTMAKRNVNRLHNLVDSLMDFSRLEAGKLEGAFRPVPIGAFTRDLAGLFLPAVERTSLKLVIDCDEDTDRAMCWVDPDLYEKIVLNLVGNAFKYTHQGTIHVSLHYAATEVVIAVSDTGVGIPAASLERIGERFFRVASVGRSHEGTGIGLSLTKELIKLHGGSMAVESWFADENAEGRHGSTFTVRLPLGPDHLPMVHIAKGVTDDKRRGRFATGVIDEVMQWNRDQDSSLESSSEAGSAAIPSGTSDRTGSSLDPSTLFFTKEDVILIVDDSKDLRTWLVSLFKPYVGKVVEASDGAQGLEKAMAVKPDIIISDMTMPKMDGLQFLQAVRADEDLKFTPFILLTARAGESDLTTGLLTGAEDYMVKPFVSRELVARASLQVQLGKRRRILEKAFAQRLEEVEKRRQEAEQERKRQELLIDVTSHELRNPTSAIIQCSQMVGANLRQLRHTLQHVYTARQSLNITEDLVEQLKADEELCRNINSCAQNQSRIADDVLALARINLDMLHFVMVPTIIRKRIQDVVKPFMLEAESNGIDLVLDLTDPSLDQVPYSITDPFRLGQVIVNLVGNAMRYAAEGATQRVKVKAVISPEPPSDTSCKPPTTPFPTAIQDGDECYLYISVSDSGPGLQQSDVALLFKRFSQASKQSNKVFGGSGLGLWISKQISHQMGGRIEVDSEYGQGCTFRFFVRITACPSQKRALEDDDDAPAEEEEHVAKRRDIKPDSKIRVLVVEDNMINQKVLLRQLRKAGMYCEAANNGLEAVTRLRQVCATEGGIDAPFDVVLMDVSMPVMDGLTAIGIIRDEERAGKLHRSWVFALTGNARQAQVDDALAHGMDAVIIKPYTLDSLIERIHGVL